MKTKIEVDGALLAEVVEVSRIMSDREAVEAALRSFLENERLRRALDELRGIGWEGDLDAMREGRLSGELR